MASAEPAAAIEARLRSQFTAAEIHVANDLLDTPDPSSGPFVVLEFPGGTADTITVGAPGNNIHRERGAFMIHVMVPTSSGASAARTMAEQIASIFRAQTFDRVICGAPFPPQEDTGPDGNWFGVSFSTPYQYDRFA